MPTPFESAQLNLQLFDLRREAVLREARAWFLFEFNPESFADMVAIVPGRAQRGIPHGTRLLGHGRLTRNFGSN